MNGVTNGSNENPELIAAADGLLLDAEDHRAQILVVGEVVPVLGPVEVLLVGFLLDGGQLEALVLLPLLLNGRLLSGDVLVLELVLLKQTQVSPLVHHRELRLLINLLGIREIAVALALVPNCVRGYLGPRALDPISWGRD